MRPRRLALTRETLTELATSELALVAGAAAAHTIPDLYCVTQVVRDLNDQSVSIICDAYDPTLVGCPSSPCTR